MRLTLALTLFASATALPAAAVPVLQATTVFSNIVGGTAEIPAYDPSSNRIFVSNPSFGEIRYYDATSGALLGALPTGSLGLGAPNSVAVGGGRVAIAFEAVNRQNPGTVVVYDTSNLAAAPRLFTVGAVPDQLTFTKDGKRILVSNEGEPNSYNQPTSVDPQGSISIITLANNSVATAGFGSFNAQKAALQASGVRIFGPNASVAQDLEPEYLAISADGKKAYVTLQENNAIAVVDIASATVTAIRPLGFQNYGPGGAKLDPSDRDGPGATPLPGNFQNRAGLYGLYQPDAIATFKTGGVEYTITANEGDARDYTGFAEETRIGGAVPFNRLTITTTLGATGPAGATAYTLGGRSFSIRDLAGNLVFDSGDALDRITFTQFPALFDDGRSDNKGTEPEGVVVGKVDGRTIAFIGLERTLSGLVLAFDLTDFSALNPVAPFIGGIRIPNMVAPEGLSFFRRDGRSFLAVAGEVTGTLAVVELDIIGVPAPATLALFGLGLVALGAARRRRG